MACFHPIKAWKMKNWERFDTGKCVIRFARKNSNGEWNYPDIPGREKLDLPCGKCIGCRVDYSKSWAIRCFHEASMSENNCFITLTFDNQHLDSKGSLNKKDFVLFMKSFREFVRQGFMYVDEFGRERWYSGHTGIRFYQCGEYGERFGRPHHHAIIFGFDFPDKRLVKSDGKVNVYSSDILNGLWRKGFTSVSDVTFASCAYVARYILKKITGDRAPDYYQGRQPEYVTMSRRPGIGGEWFREFGKTDVYNTDFIYCRENGIKVRPPRYYDKLFEELDPKLLQTLKERRIERAKAVNADSPSLESRKKCLQQKLNRKVRSYEKSID